MNVASSLPRLGALVAVLLGAAVVVPQAAAQPFPLGSDAWLKQAYGLGVQSFFSGDYQRAYDELTDVVAAASAESVNALDPRVLYFRGLAARRLGRFDEAEADFARGAALEAEATGDWPVGRSLERIQGPDRLALERYRLRSRIAKAHAETKDSDSGLGGARGSNERTRGPRRGTGTGPRFGDEEGRTSSELPPPGAGSPLDPANGSEELPAGPAAPSDDAVNRPQLEAPDDGVRADGDPADPVDESAGEPPTTDVPDDEFEE